MSTTSYELRTTVATIASALGLALRVLGQHLQNCEWAGSAFHEFQRLEKQVMDILERVRTAISPEQTDESDYEIVYRRELTLLHSICTEITQQIASVLPPTRLATVPELKRDLDVAQNLIGVVSHAFAEMQNADKSRVD